MLDFEIFATALRRVFLEFISARELTSEALEKLPERFHHVTAKLEFSAEKPATLWLNVTDPGIRIAMEKLKVIRAEEDRMLMDTAGELLNIIAGSAQRSSSVRYDFSLPSAFKGESYPVRFEAQTKKTGRRFIFEDFEAILILEQEA